jgi:hypothetical protein
LEANTTLDATPLLLPLPILKLDNQHALHFPINANTLELYERPSVTRAQFLAYLRRFPPSHKVLSTVKRYFQIILPPLTKIEALKVTYTKSSGQRLYAKLPAAQRLPA